MFLRVYKRNFSFIHHDPADPQIYYKRDLVLKVHPSIKITGFSSWLQVQFYITGTVGVAVLNDPADRRVSALPQARFDIRSTLDPTDRRVFRVATRAI